MHEIIIIGAGVSGLIIAKKLSGKGKKVLLLEASDRIGGRINTICDNSFDTFLETGAEFVHGNLPLTIGILKEAGIPYYKIEGEMVTVKNGEWDKIGKPIKGWNKLLKKMKALKKDMALADFLETYFPGEKHAELRSTVRHYAEGFDLVDITTASTTCLRNEWLKEDGDQYRIEGGYNKLTQFLLHACEQNGVSVHTSSEVISVEWKKNEVIVRTRKRESFTGNKVVITVPPPGLHNTEERDTIEFTPAIPVYISAIERIGYGSVIKLFLQFKDAFWKEQSGELGFIISNQVIPTWWTQLPNKSNLLTGWLGGPGAKALQNSDHKIILRLGLESLANIFSSGVDTLESLLQSWKITDWNTMPFIHGGYSFATVKTTGARKLLEKPIEETIYFAGEGIRQSDSPGTVEAALESGIKIADHIIGY